MNFTKDDINKIAHLARLSLQPAEVERFVYEVTNTVELISKLNQVNTDEVVMIAHPLNQTQRLREDKVTEHDQHKKFQKIAPNVEADLYIVPQVIE
jgi:aspartyl-tRNA(Asn)/glutamyl-tRNA(Gln) amidotransferase subunit C